MQKIDINTAFNKSVFLLGAGASFGTKENRVGCKMSSEMFKDLEEKIRNPKDNSLSETETETFRFLISTLYYQNKWRSLEKNADNYTPNIEELALIIRRIKNRENYLPYPLTGNWADKLIHLENSYQKENKDTSLFDEIERKLKNEFVREWLNINQNALGFLNPLKDIMNNQNLINPIEFFTLNYDKTIELFLEKEEVTPYCGFVSGEWKGTRIKDVEGFDKLNLTKLHGSLDWVRLSTSGNVKEIEKLSEEEKEDVDINHNPYIVFGHGTKTFSFDPFFDMAINFREKLAKRSYIFAIGYSFFDPYINNLLIEALNNNPYGKLIIINPDKFGLNKIATHNIDLVDFIEKIQYNSFYSELPEFNIKRINGTNRIIHLINTEKKIYIGFDEFLSDYFNDAGEQFIELINKFEVEREKEENPF